MALLLSYMLSSNIHRTFDSDINDSKHSENNFNPAISSATCDSSCVRPMSPEQKVVSVRRKPTNVHGSWLITPVRGCNSSSSYLLESRGAKKRDLQASPIYDNNAMQSEGSERGFSRENGSIYAMSSDHHLVTP